MRRHDIAEDKESVRLEQRAKYREQAVELGLRQILRDRVHDDEIERGLRQHRRLLGGDHGDLRMPRIAHGQRGAHVRRSFDQHQLRAGVGDEVG